MDWNKFMQALQDSGVEEITLKFRETKSMSSTKKIISHDQKKEDDADDDGSIQQNSDAPVKTKTVTETNALAMKVFRENNKNWHTADEYCEATGFSHSMINKLLREHNIPKKKIGRVMLHNTEQFWLERQVYEEDILRHDGERQGNVKFIGSELSKLITYEN